MTGTPDTAGNVSADWDRYWRNKPSEPDLAGSSGGSHDEALERFWSQLFDQAFCRTPAMLKMIDIGCGTGAVSRLAVTSARNHGVATDLLISGLDHSHAAVSQLRGRTPQVTCVAADAAHAPFPDQTFDLVTSQFGIEYAGPDAPAEAARLLRSGGTLAAALHVRDGGIYQECEINRKAVDAVRDCRLLEYFGQVFEAVPRARQGAAGKAQFDDLDQKFAAAVTKADGVFQRWGKGVASGLVFRLYTDIAHMYRQLGAYEPHDVLAWVDYMTRELDNYSLRMTSMLDAALNPEQFSSVTARLRRHGLRIELENLLGVGAYQSIPVAWVVIAVKGASA